MLLCWSNSGKIKVDISPGCMQFWLSSQLAVRLCVNGAHSSVLGPLTPAGENNSSFKMPKAFFMWRCTNARCLCNEGNCDCPSWMLQSGSLFSGCCWKTHCLTFLWGQAADRWEKAGNHEDVGQWMAQGDNWWGKTKPLGSRSPILIYTRSAVMEGVRGFIHLFWFLLHGGFMSEKGISRNDSLSTGATM